MFEVLPEFDLVPNGWPSVDVEPNLAAVRNADYEALQNCEKVVKPDFLGEYRVHQMGSSSSRVDS